MGGDGLCRATFEVLGRRGHSKLSLSDVAAQAKVSRPTLYRLFSSKEKLLAAFGGFEQRTIEEGCAPPPRDRPDPTGWTPS
ncbi:helix-turn-helix domain-containing protein [Nocardia asiatica]|uniref:helix-turn-helix domain-containing protein n=1 Tax=Nocardia asiatica TaxID=209252 RepID=UPI00313CCC1D